MRAIPSDIGGFSIQKADGPEVELVKKNGEETVIVEFNVNDSTEDDVPQSGEEENVKFVAKPEFTVLINKGGDLTLGIHCVFPQNFEEQEQQDDYEETIQISEVAVLKGKQEWDDAVYCHSGDVMDGDLYDMLLTTLEERGVTAEFVDSLVEFSTSYEHKQYVSFLESFKSFTAK